MTKIRESWSWADNYLPHVREIVGPLLLEAAPLAVDRNQAADLVVLRARDLNVAVRIRRAEYSIYQNQFTLRAGRPSGTKSEWSKVCEGMASWFFYGFASATEPGRLSSWNLIDLDAFRAHLIHHPERIVKGERTNADGTTFRWFDLASFPSEPKLLVASSRPIERKNHETEIQTPPRSEVFGNVTLGR